jgi:hypothetical protein
MSDLVSTICTTTGVSVLLEVDFLVPPIPILSFIVLFSSQQRPLNLIVFVCLSVCLKLSYYKHLAVLGAFHFCPCRSSTSSAGSEVYSWYTCSSAGGPEVHRATPGAQRLWQPTGEQPKGDALKHPHIVVLIRGS